MPSLPTYAVYGCNGIWVSSTDLARCAGLESDGILGSLGIVRTAKCFAFVDTDGSLTKAGTSRARGCGAMVGVACLQRARSMATVWPLLAPAVPGVPIVMRAPPSVRRARSGVKRPRDGSSLHISSVKMTLTSRLNDPAARQFLEAIVDCVSHASRFGSYLLNLHVMRLLDDSGGVLSDKPAE